jgi:hypothetical protein
VNQVCLHLVWSVWFFLWMHLFVFFSEVFFDTPAYKDRHIYFLFEQVFWLFCVCKRLFLKLGLGSPCLIPYLGGDFFTDLKPLFMIWRVR